MLAENGNGPANFEDRDEDGWPVGRQEEPSETHHQEKAPHTKQKKNSPCNGKSDQQRNQLYETQTNRFRTVRFVQMTTVGQCDKNVHDQTKNTNESTNDGNTNVCTHWRTFVTATGKTVVAVVMRALATHERGIDVGGVASCGAVATVAVGQIKLVGVVQKILAHQGGVGATQTCRWKCATFKGSVVVVAP